jgi:hypothetical protein
MAFPKMTLRLDLIGDDQVSIKLIQITNTYTRKVGVENNIFTKNGWMFFVNNMFSINIHSKFIIIPKNPVKDIDILIFKNDRERKKVLKEINDTLLQWSGNEIFNDIKLLSNEPYIRYYKDMWIIF